jgi:hypothetical protein
MKRLLAGRAKGKPETRGDRSLSRLHSRTKRTIAAPDDRDTKHFCQNQPIWQQSGRTREATGVVTKAFLPLDRISRVPEDGREA